MYITIEELKSIGVKHYYIDWDSTLMNSVKAVVSILNKRYSKNINYKDIEKWNFTDMFPTSSKEIEEIFNGSEFFEVAEFFDGAIEFLSENKDKVTIFTIGDEQNLKLKKDILISNGLSNMELIGIPLGKSKSCVDMSGCVFIDDVTNNLYDSNAKYKIQFREFYEDKEWNSNWNGLKMKRWY